MSFESSDPEFEASFCEDGRFEIREYDRPDRWISCEDPVDVRP